LWFPVARLVTRQASLVVTCFRPMLLDVRQPLIVVVVLIEFVRFVRICCHGGGSERLLGEWPQGDGAEVHTNQDVVRAVGEFPERRLAVAVGWSGPRESDLLHQRYNRLERNLGSCWIPAGMDSARILHVPGMG